MSVALWLLFVIAALWAVFFAQAGIGCAVHNRKSPCPVCRKLNGQPHIRCARKMNQ